MTLAPDIPLTDPTDGELLARFAASPPDQTAFEELVRRHIDWLYAAALRITRNPAYAEDVTQAVLWSLARKARSLSHRQYVGGWLHEATRYAATTLLRSERRRKERERMAIPHTPYSEEELAWAALQPRIDQAIARLPAPDRNAILLRFMQRKSHEEIGALLGITPEAARKRVTRALERLREKIGAKRSAAAMGATLLAAPIHAAPPHLVPAVMAGKISAQAALLSKGILVMHKALIVKLAFAAAVLTVSAGLLITTISTFAQSTPVPAPPAPVPTDAAPPGALAQAPAPTTATPPVFIGQPGGVSISADGTAVGVPAIPQPFVMQLADGGGGGVRAFGGGGGGRSMSVSSNGTSTIRTINDGQNQITLTTNNGNTTAVVKDSTGKVLFDGPYASDADKAKAPAEVRTLLDRAPQAQPVNFVFTNPGMALGRSTLSLDAIKQQLGVTDAEWSDMQERIKTIQTLQAYLAAGTSASTVNPAAGSPEAANPILGPVHELTEAIADKNLKPEDLDAKVTAVRAARIEVQESLAKARHKLEDSLTPRQKAILVNLQILE